MEKVFEQVADRITFAAMNYRIWRVYTEPDNRKKYLRTLQRYNAFFHTSIQAHFATTIITLYALYEPSRKGIGLPNLVRQAPDAVKAKVQPLLDEANGIWRKKITLIRNQLYAHLQYVDSWEAKLADAAITPNQIERLIELSKQILNELSRAHDRSTFAFNLTPNTDTVALLDKLFVE